MEVRDAVEADAKALAAIADAPVDVMENVIHDRTVRVAVSDGDGGEDHDDENHDDEKYAPGDGAVGGRVAGFVSFDARPDAVHVTQITGGPEACERLLSEPVSFARGEGMPVELLVPVGDDDVREAAEAAGFQRRGSGPRFDGRPTVRYRREH